MDILFCAIRLRILDLVQILAPILDLNQKHPIHSYPIFYAARMSSYEVFKIILEHSNPEILDEHDSQVLHYITNPKFATLYPWNVNHKNNKGNTPLHHMVIFGNLPMISYLLDKCAQFYQNNLGKSPLHLAVEMDEVEIVKKFSEYVDFNPNQQDTNGNTCLHLAIKNKSHKMVQFLTPYSHFLVKNHQGKYPHDLLVEHRIDKDLVYIIAEVIDKAFYSETLTRKLLDMSFMLFYKTNFYDANLIQKFDQIKVYSFMREKFLSELTK
jgi:ankyrin repeat protein